MPEVTGGTKSGEVADDLRARNPSGDLAPGDLVPSEPELMEQYHYSRDTVRKAARPLLNEGLVDDGQGDCGGCASTPRSTSCRAVRVMLSAQQSGSSPPRRRG